MICALARLTFIRRLMRAVTVMFNFNFYEKLVFMQALPDYSSI